MTRKSRVKATDFGLYFSILSNNINASLKNYRSFKIVCPLQRIHYWESSMYVTVTYQKSATYIEVDVYVGLFPYMNS